LVSGKSLSGASIHPHAQLHHLGDGVKTLAGLLLATLLTMTAGCAQKDWIDRTLVTVDVTGTWRSDLGWELNLEQQGSKVNGTIKHGTIQSSVGPSSGQIDGTVAGDTFTFKRVDGKIAGEVTVSGDEMTGRVSGQGVTERNYAVFLKRVDPSSRPASPPR
jgi:hypothetical protein